MTDVNDDAPRDGEISQGSVTPDLPPTLLESAMATGEDDGTPGERGPIDPSDTTALEVADDAPDLSQNGGPQGDGLEPRFSEPTD